MRFDALAAFAVWGVGYRVRVWSVCVRVSRQAFVFQSRVPFQNVGSGLGIKTCATAAHTHKTRTGEKREWVKRIQQIE